MHGVALLRYFGVYFDRFYLLFFLRLLQGAWRLVGAALIDLVLTHCVHLTNVCLFIESLQGHVLVIDDIRIRLVYRQLRRDLIEGYALLATARRVACQRHSLAAAMTVSVTRLQASCRHLPVYVSRDGRSARAAHASCDVTPVAICGCTCCSSFHSDDSFRLYFFVDIEPARCTVLFSLVRYSNLYAVRLCLLMEFALALNYGICSLSNNESRFI